MKNQVKEEIEAEEDAGEGEEKDDGSVIERSVCLEGVEGASIWISGTVEIDSVLDSVSDSVLDSIDESAEDEQEEELESEETKVEESEGIVVVVVVSVVVVEDKVDDDKEENERDSKLFAKLWFESRGEGDPGTNSSGGGIEGDLGLRGGISNADNLIIPK